MCALDVCCRAGWFGRLWFVWSTYGHALWLLADYVTDIIFVAEEVRPDEGVGVGVGAPELR